MSETPFHDLGPDQQEQDSGAGRLRAGMVRIAAWSVVTLALLAYLAVGSVSAIWYRYNAFTERTVRQDESRDIVQIWTDWMSDLPGDSAISVLFVGAIAAVVILAVWGAWLLLVSSRNLDPRSVRGRQ